MSVGVLSVMRGAWRFQNDGMRVREIQRMKAGKKKSRSLFLVSSMSVRASCAGLRCSQEQTVAGSSGCEDQQQFRVALFSSCFWVWCATELLEPGSVEAGFFGDTCSVRMRTRKNKKTEITCKIYSFEVEYHRNLLTQPLLPLPFWRHL